MSRRNENIYSRFVAWAKIILPILGLAILSSLFLFSKSRTPGKGARLFDGSLAKFASKERITGPRFAGMTPSGVAIELSAKQASPRPGSSGFDATDLKAHMKTRAGQELDITANTGTIDSLARSSKLAGGVTLKTSFGYTALTRGLTFSLDSVNIQSDGKISAFGPLGKIEAGGLHLFLEQPKKGDVTGGYVLEFKNRVRLVYNPDK